MKIDLSYYFPPGISREKEIRAMAVGLGASGGWSLGFLVRYLDQYRRLFQDQNPRTGILVGRMMPSFSAIMGNGMIVFLLYWGALAGLAVWHYLYHRKGAMTVYLMRRLPRRMEYHRRCLSFPLAAAVAGLALVGLLGGIYCAIYVFCTPAVCLGGF